MDLDEDDYNSSHVSGIIPFQSANNTLEGTTFYTCENCSVSTDCGCSINDKVQDTPCSTKNFRYLLIEFFSFDHRLKSITIPGGRANII